MRGSHNINELMLLLYVGHRCIGQSVALVLADTFQHALAASRAVVVTVTAPVTAPNFTIAAALADSSFLIEVRCPAVECTLGFFFLVF